MVEQHVIPFYPDFDEELAQVIPEISTNSGKPFVVALPQTSATSKTMTVEETRRKYREWYISHSIPVFDSLVQATQIMGKIKRYNEYRSMK